MVFNSFHFAVFFLVVYALYRVMPHRQQNWLLLLASYYFYGSWDWRFLLLLLGSTGHRLPLRIYIDRHDDRRKRRTAVIVSLAFNLSMLGFFKYFNFFAGSLQTLLRGFGLRADYATLHIVLPIGISFYTFITMSYVIDVYRRDVKPCRNLRDFALFVAYFPHLVAGPILRADWLLPQITRPRTIRATRSVTASGSWSGGSSRRSSSPTTSPMSRTRFSTRRSDRAAWKSCSASTRSRFRSTATSPGIRTSRAARRSAWASS